jgi:hypothetical protein
MFSLLLALFIDTAEAHPARHGHHHPPPARYETRPPRQPPATRYVYRTPRPPPYRVSPVPRVGFRFIWNGIVWLEVPLHYSQIIWVPGHYDRWGYWVPGYYQSV